MEALAKAPLTGRQFRLVLLIMNQTDGYLKDTDHLGPKFLVQRTGMSKANCYHVLAELKSMVIVESPKPGIFKVLPPEHWKLPTESPLSRQAGVVKQVSPITPLQRGVAKAEQVSPITPYTDVADNTLPMSPITPLGVADNTKPSLYKENPLKKPSKENVKEVSTSLLGAVTPVSKYFFEKSRRKRWSNLVQKEEFEKCEAEVGEEAMMGGVKWALGSGITNIKSMITAARKRKDGTGQSSAQGQFTANRGHTQGPQPARGKEATPEYLDELARKLGQTE